uniref:7TM_GPCR_Srx domain-containing protein n=1 Tax=Meloidogyne hapla TaxID=6305 RepID=A0A1I8BEY5_MELHA
MSLNSTTTITTINIPPQIFINIAYILSILELIFHFFILFISLLNLLILFKTNILHPNLRILLIGQSLSIILFEIQREILISQKLISGDIFTSGHIILQFVYCIFNSLSISKSWDITLMSNIINIVSIITSLAEFMVNKLFD